MWVDSICLVCLKVIRKSGETSTPSSFARHESLFRKFVLLSERLLGLPETTISNLRLVSSRKETGHILCTDCETVISSTCKVYQDLCTAQLNLGWRLKQLQDSIRSHNQLSPKLRSVLQKRVAAQLGFPGGPEQVRLVHRQLSRHCAQLPGSQKEVSIPLERISISDMKIGTSGEVNATDSSVYDKKFATGVIKVENNVDEEADEDRDDLFQNYEASQDEDFSPNPATLKSEDTSHFESSVVHVDSIDVVYSKLRARKTTKSYSDRRTCKTLKRIKKLEKPKKARLKFPPYDRDRSELTCRVCIHYVANSLKRLRRHLADRHENKWKIRNKSKRPPFQCYFCHWAFAYEQSHQVHLELSPHTLYLTKGKFICSEGNCDNLEFPNFSDLNIHFEKDHHSQTLFRCNLCSWPFLTDEMRVVHEFVHVKVKSGGSFDCPKCKRKCTSVIGLQNHYIEQHTSLSLSDSKMYSCPICPAKLRYPDRFQEHLKRHEMESQASNGVPRTGEYWTCPHEDCDKSYPSRRLLQLHRRIHKTTQCSKCGKLVPKMRLSEHMKIRHKEGQAIPCPQCGKSFFTQVKLKRHTEQVHNPEYPMTKKQCHICLKEYQRTALLDKHLRDMHQVEVEALKVPPKFICAECGKGYREKISLEIHVDAKHTEESQRRWNYKCQICLKSFWRPCLLNRHMSEVHPSGQATTGGNDVALC